MLRTICSKQADGYNIKITELKDDYFPLEATSNKTNQHDTKCSVIKLNNLDHQPHC